MRSLIKKITHPFLKFGLKLYYSKPRNYCYDDICVKVHPDVFPPHLTLSTKIILDFIKPFDLTNKTFLELGCGSGIISLFAAKKGAKVFATDINKTALKYLEKSAENNQLEITTIESNLFENLAEQSFDYIIINPPYYPKTPKNIKEQAWYCGEKFEYFENLFIQLPKFLANEIECYLILSEDCKLNKIESIANKKGVFFFLFFEKLIFGEKNFIFKLSLLNLFFGVLY